MIPVLLMIPEIVRLVLPSISTVPKFASAPLLAPSRRGTKLSGALFGTTDLMTPLPFVLNIPPEIVTRPPRSTCEPLLA